ncbi:MAG TPA: four helix bundle protein [Terriglobales bacterium]|nr:four helix bundle protein [Terriglobales bacterium]
MKAGTWRTWDRARCFVRERFRRLEVWQKSHRLSLAVYRATTSFPNEEKFGLTSQVRRCCVSIEANIAEGCGRSGDLDLRRFLYIALGSASELDCELLLARDLGFLARDAYEKLFIELRSIKAMLSTLIRKIGADNPQ